MSAKVADAASQLRVVIDEMEARIQTLDSQVRMFLYWVHTMPLPTSQ